MNTLLRSLGLVAGLLSVSALAFGAEETPAAVPAIDPVATAIWREHIEGMGGRGETAEPIQHEQLLGKALEFFEKYPTERRVGGILYNLASFSEWIKGPDAVRLRREWRTYLRGALEDTLAHHTWPDHVWGGLEWVAIRNEVDLQQETGRPDLAAFKTRMATVAARVPGDPYRIALEQYYVELLRRYEPTALRPYLASLSQSTVPELVELGQGQLAVENLRADPMELKFTALDGRTVDLAQLRGQVVLIDCWATWCAPCVKELPHVKAALDRWGTKGFAVIGISFDRAADRAKLVKFVADQGLSWPQWANDPDGPKRFGQQYNIRSIPATFLLGKDGRLITTETRGEKLEAELAKLLGPANGA